MDLDVRAAVVSVDRANSVVVAHEEIVVDVNVSRDNGWLAGTMAQLGDVRHTVPRVPRPMVAGV